MHLVVQQTLLHWHVVSDTICLNVCLLTQFYFMFYVNDKIMLYVKWVEQIHFEFEF